MKHKVRIQIKGLQGGLADQVADNDSETIEMTVDGHLYHQHGHTYIVYEDIMLDEAHPVKTTVKIYEGNVDIKRYGTIDHHMVFAEGNSHHSHYETPFGVLDITVNTSSVKIDEQPDSLDLDITYQLEVNNTKIGDAFFQLKAITI